MVDTPGDGKRYEVRCRHAPAEEYMTLAKACTLEQADKLVTMFKALLPLCWHIWKIEV